MVSLGRKPHPSVSTQWLVGAHGRAPHDASLKDRLIAYNVEDCRAAGVVTRRVTIPGHRPIGGCPSVPTEERRVCSITKASSQKIWTFQKPRARVRWNHRNSLVELPTRQDLPQLQERREAQHLIPTVRNRSLERNTARTKL